MQDAINRLKTLAQINKRTAIEMQEEAGRFSRLASRHDNGTAPRAISAFNLFQTPEHIAEQMAVMVAAHVRPGAKILEPSAGLGRLYRALVMEHITAEITLVEQSRDCIKELYGMTDDDPKSRLINADFLEMSIDDAGGPFDAVWRGRVAALLHGQKLEVRVFVGQCQAAWFFAGSLGPARQTHAGAWAINKRAFEILVDYAHFAAADQPTNESTMSQEVVSGHGDTTSAHDS